MTLAVWLTLAVPSAQAAAWYERGLGATRPWDLVSVAGDKSPLERWPSG